MVLVRLISEDGNTGRYLGYVPLDISSTCRIVVVFIISGVMGINDYNVSYVSELVVSNNSSDNIYIYIMIRGIQYKVLVG